MVKYYLKSLRESYDDESFKKENLYMDIDFSLGVIGEEGVIDFTLEVISYEILLNNINDYESLYIGKGIVIEEFSLEEIEKHIESVIDKCNLNKSEDSIFNCLKENFEFDEY